MNYWSNKVVVITGGSAGLGFEFARTLSELGANLVLIARDREKLLSAAQSLPHPDNALCLVADVTNRSDVNTLPSQIIERFGQVNALINCAGKSSRGKLLDTSPDDFRELWEINFLATVHCTQVFSTALSETNGHVVHIGSLASKVAAKYLGAYPTSKFPLAAFSQQLRLEVDDAFHVLLVCPGPIARPDAGSRYSDQAVPVSAQQPGGGAKLKGLPPQRVVSATLRACRKRQPEIILPAKTKVLLLVSALSASWGDWLLRKFTS